ncbi:MAG TPA: glycosyltransferase family A protein [Noviherbaspirillum sp.]|jgi:cellulose synthase/poly-beta-1,6-N-acetylglucosamine synthase-like glycosyltransferase|uniref:glycosyltransferase family 2 protein n=1 Tax=Noviherbaspirillum sp. TaxID=1926288 RepID=UPI002F95E63A
MHRPLLSLIVATVGRTTELASLFASLRAQTWRHFEVIVVDQNPDDRLRPVLASGCGPSIVIRHLRLQPANLSLARNAGLDLASGEWVGFPDDDCCYRPDTLERLASHFDGRQAMSGVAARWDELIDAATPRSRLTWARSRTFRDVPCPSFTLFFHRRLFDRIGGFDPRLGVGQRFGAGEETDLVLRALRAGAHIDFEPAAIVSHPLKEPVPGTASRRAERLRASGAGALYRKHALPPWVILRGLLAPVIRPLSRGRFGEELALGYAVTRGRLDGWLGWGGDALPACRRPPADAVAPASSVGAGADDVHPGAVLAVGTPDDVEGQLAA